MDLNRTFLAVALSIIILLGWQYLFPPPVLEPPPEAQQQGETTAQSGAPATDAAPAVPAAPSASPTPPAAIDPGARDITVDTPLYTAVISEQGGAIKSFKLKQFRAGIEKDSGPMELVGGQGADNPAARPLLFSLDNGAAALSRYTAQGDTRLNVSQGSNELVMRATHPSGLEITRTLRFAADSYLISARYDVKNPGATPVQVSPALLWAGAPFPHINPPSSYIFAGPAAYVNGELSEIKDKDLRKEPFIRQGAVSWTGYEDSYFLSTVMPESAEPLSLSVHLIEGGTRAALAHGPAAVPPEGGASFVYTLYMGPKKLSILRNAGHDLNHAVDYGWFTLIAKPMLWLLNFFYSFTRNYGIAIILLTIVIRGAFWPITQKGMQSMKNMQKLQPKMTKLREKYKDDPQRLNQEVMALYKAYKVNPLGGCLPMLIQFPFFIALYRVLMQAIELRHAPFMLWMNDLSMPDRLPVGFDIPLLHGLPVLTLLMGGSMFLQQKMTPTAVADPTQQRIMQWLPVIFTVMFINFASGLVLYWFVNNLLSMLQQYLINKGNKKQEKPEAPEKDEAMAAQS